MKASDGIGTLRSQLSPLVPLGEVKWLNFVPRPLTIDLILFGQIAKGSSKDLGCGWSIVFHNEKYICTSG